MSWGHSWGSSWGSSGTIREDSINRVVLGDLSKYRSNKEAINIEMGSIEVPIVVNNSTNFSFEIYPLGYSSRNHTPILDSGQDYYANTGFALLCENTTNTIEIWTGSSGFNTGVLYSLKTTYKISKTADQLQINDSVFTIPSITENGTVSVVGQWAGAQAYCIFAKFLIGGYSYVNDGDFGSSGLPSIPSGNDGTMNGAQWWKLDENGDPIDQNFATPQLYKDTLVSPLTEDQYVIYTDATPYYGSDDPFWNPYNQDATYSFSVVQQSLGARAGAYHYSFSYEY